MKLEIVHRKSKKVDKLIQKNFGPDESLWDPKCFDFIYKLIDGHKILAVCTLQWTDQGYWILGDVCSSVHGQGFGSEIVRQICEQISEPIWADATTPGSIQILERNSFKPTTIQPWDPHGKSYIFNVDVD
jgi:hypothetical protein